MLGFVGVVGGAGGVDTKLPVRISLPPLYAYLGLGFFRINPFTIHPLIKTKYLFYEMRMRKTHVIVVYTRIRTLHEANVLSLMAGQKKKEDIFCL